MTDAPAYKITKLDKPIRAGARPKSVGVDTRLTSTGEKVKVLTVDAHSPTFGEDLLYVFKRNVQAARRENKAILGALSGVKKRS
jgi:hypothetical protein